MEKKNKTKRELRLEIKSLIKKNKFIQKYIIYIYK